LKGCRLKNISQPTVYRWMKTLGFSYCDRRKTYYVDGHERDDVVAYRTEFCSRYLTVYEPRCKRWVQMPKQMALKHPALEGCGYSYEGTDHTEMCEFHIDDVPDEVAAMFPLKMSVRAPSNSLPVIIIGQDECVFSQFLLTSKIWVGPHKESPLLPKSDGESQMISAFQSRDFGFGLQISKETLALVNASHHNQNYCDTTAATEVFGCISKKPLSETLFLQSITVGANNDGYWNSYHMAVQLEDCVDCLRVLYPEHDFVFLFDHSQGHCKKCTAALQSEWVSLLFGGEQPIMCDSEIMEGCLGRFDPKLRVGNIQKMYFQSTDEGPFYFSDTEKEL